VRNCKPGGGFRTDTVLRRLASFLLLLPFGFLICTCTCLLTCCFWEGEEEEERAVACVMPRGVRALEGEGATTELRIGVIGGSPKEENTRDIVGGVL